MRKRSSVYKKHSNKKRFNKRLYKPKVSCTEVDISFCKPSNGFIIINDIIKGMYEKYNIDIIEEINDFAKKSK